MRVVLRDFAARGLPPETGRRRPATPCGASSAPSCAVPGRTSCPHLRAELLEHGGLLLLDGLDEVPEADQRRAQVKQAVQGFVAAFPQLRVLVTSRTYAYQKQDWKLHGFAEAVLAPFGAGADPRCSSTAGTRTSPSGAAPAAEDAQGGPTLLKPRHRAQRRACASWPSGRCC